MTPPPASMSGRTCMITGPTSGIGHATALALAQQGARLVLVCRDRTRGEATIAEIRQKTGNQTLELRLADLSSQQSIRDFARAFLSTDRPLHVLINNAGVVNLGRSLTVDGIETVFAVNYLAYFLLTELLLERLKASAPARIVNVASDAHRWGTINFEDLGGERSFKVMRIYGQSKLANIIYTYELSRRLAGTNVTVNCLHPGAVGTGLGKNNGAWARVLIGMLRPFFRTPEGGAATSIYLASSPEIEGVTGKYFVDCKPKRSSAASYDENTARRLWDVSAQMTGLTA